MLVCVTLSSTPGTPSLPIRPFAHSTSFPSVLAFLREKKKDENKGKIKDRKIPSLSLSNNCPPLRDRVLQESRSKTDTKHDERPNNRRRDTGPRSTQCTIPQRNAQQIHPLPDVSPMFESDATGSACSPAFVEEGDPWTKKSMSTTMMDKQKAKTGKGTPYLHAMAHSPVPVPVNTLDVSSSVPSCDGCTSRLGAEASIQLEASSPAVGASGPD